MEVLKMKKTGVIFILLMAIAAIGLSCNFTIEAESQTVSKGDEFYIKVTVLQDHGSKCTLPSEDEYNFDAENIELLGMTQWEEVAKYTLQTWVKVRALDEGDGWVRISKTCKKEGYDEELIQFNIQ
jgi:hypothetical protein